MRNNRYIIGSACALSLLAASCGDDGVWRDHSADGALELRLQARIRQVNLTRADDSGFADGDRIGIYVVNYVDEKPGELLEEGNQASNVRFTYDEAASP